MRKTIFDVPHFNILRCVLLSMMLLAFSVSKGEETVWFDGKTPVSYAVVTRSDAVVDVALQLFEGDICAVTGLKPESREAKNAIVNIYQLDKATESEIAGLKQSGFDIDSINTGTDAFAIRADGGKIYIVGANGRGAAYGILELSRMAGVSPWIWWGDMTPNKRDKLAMQSDINILQSASVEKRGIFLNDEDWTIRPWSYKNYEPAKFGQIGPKTYKRIFELLLRLRANAIWPGMHTGTEAFFKNPENKKIADSCAIFVGTSHCEPMLRNNVDEWDEAIRGKYNYRTNKQQVHDYWIERLKEVSNSATNMYTIGMRGIHDGSMEGYNTVQEKFDALQQVIDDQQMLLDKHIGDPSKLMQTFVPYKEVLELYEKGLKIPDYVTLIWCDDNYGYMTRLSNEAEQKREGGAGIYYHLSYWGRPHDYMWLTTTQPGLIYNEMRRAYDHNVRKLWIVNVHDPKVAAYDLELFLDMAWNINCVDSENVGRHLSDWLSMQFGQEAADALYPAMRQFYRLCGIRHPEFMGWSQVEVDKKIYDRGISQVRNSEFSTTQFGNEMDRYIDGFKQIAAIVDSVGCNLIPPTLADAYFAAIEYPVKSATLNAVKMLEAQRARQLANGSTRSDLDENMQPLMLACAKSQIAYNDIRRLTKYYNDTLAEGKWRFAMEMNPRHLPSASAPVLPYYLSDTEIDELLSSKPLSKKCHPVKADGTIARNACDFASSTDNIKVVDMLGHSMKSVSLDKGAKVSYVFDTDKAGDAIFTIAFIPTQPNDNGDLRFRVSINDGNSVEFSLKEPFRSEEWKTNVLRGQARRSLPVNLVKGRNTIEIEALDPNIIIDQWMIDFNINRKSFYLIPVIDSSEI